MEVSLRKERVEQEKKDARILEILKIKDRQLGDIQEENRTQEAQYEKLGEAFQELKLRNAVLEDRELNLTHVVRQLEAKLESVTAKLDQLESGKEYRRLLESEERLKEATQYLEAMQEGLNVSQLALQKKDNIEIYLQEVIARLKEQVSDKDAHIQELTSEWNSEKELRIRADEQARTFETQLKSENPAKS